MKAVERIIVKLIIIQALFLGLVQVLLSLEDNMIPLTKLSQYEGVNSNNYTKIIETFEGVSE
ncbi:YpfB family protein [Peribacillus asahii]|uniref:Cytidylate kinase n=1 Tax=Peribacillus asahii TaxID=228899 RepID=A0A3Q9RL04_9BACI|nr:YpfB family protein [Peribacillus asahii]AZV44160.1 cytidylate kinase [Peribacillus asahii]USK69009.1 YpfB family protein [Peribacillus asahii]USK83877.1 YpfB family protein [Peribacillus asahii]